MPFCSIMTCKNDSRNVNLTHGGITYHRFPRDPELRATWTEATGRVNWIPKEGSSICSSHFDDKYFMVKEQHRKRLCSHAIPTLNVLSFHTKMQIVTFEQVEEPLRTECQPQLVEILNEQGLSRANVSVMVPLKTPEHDNHENNYDDEDDDEDESDFDENKFTRRELKLKAKLRWTRDEINKQRRTIKNHEMQIFRLQAKRKETKKLLDLLQDKFAMPIQEIVKIDFRQ